MVKNSFEIFDSIDRQTSTILSIKLLDVILKHSTEILNTKEIIGHNLNQRDVAALQYLGGYVCRNIYKKIRCGKGYKTKESQQALSLLLCCKTERNDGFELVSSLDRGGLWYISDHIQKVFVITEKYFCLQIKNNPSSTSINIRKMSLELAKLPFVEESFDMLVGKTEVEIDKETKKNLLFGIIKLYLQVRAFSYAKDTTYKFKAEQKKKKEKGGLRKNIKNSMAENLPSKK